MAIDVPKVSYNGTIREIALDKDAKVVVGGESAYPFYGFEGAIPREPLIAIQVLDYAPDDWAEALVEPYKDVINDPVAWAKKAQDVYKADIIHLWLKSTDPNGLNRGAEEAAEIAKKVSDAVSVPLIVWGSSNEEKDVEVLRKVAEVCGDKQILIGPVAEGNHKQLGAAALAYNHLVVANSPIDINLAKQLNILLNNLGLPLERIIIDPTTGGVGYGLEYSYSVMERIRQAALTQNDDKLQNPFIANLAEEAWKTKEAKTPDDPKLGDAGKRGVMLESMTAISLLLAGAEILVMRHPESIKLVRSYINDMLGKEPVEEEIAVDEAAAVEEAVGAEGFTIPKEVDFDTAYGVVKVLYDYMTDVKEGKIASKAEVEKVAVVTEEKVSEEKKAEEFIEEPEISFKDAFAALNSLSSEEVSEKLIDKEGFDGKHVKVLGSTFEPGIPTGKEDWRVKLTGREDEVKYLKTGLRYWYSDDWYGS
ncbi:MAG: acetyl-CoA decarbonylase/synthase complex subunit delta, partial [Deltaproteobacteria bacterium]|nr:acetyl-CoA decarbonylase/synthase complex subunit delta [Deltaproteobacteria bacterium]